MLCFCNYSLSFPPGKDLKSTIHFQAGIYCKIINGAIFKKIKYKLTIQLGFLLGSDECPLFFVPAGMTTLNSYVFLITELSVYRFLRYFCRYLLVIIFRYLVKEVYSASFAVTSVLLLIFLSNQFIRFLTITAAGKLPAVQILYLLSLEIPQLLCFLLPLGLYIGLLLAYGRLYADSEMVVLNTCGLSVKRLMGYTMFMALMIFIVVSLLSFWLSPYVAKTRNHALDEIKDASALQTILPGSFQAVESGSKVYYVQNMSNDRQQLKGIFEADEIDTGDNAVPEAWNVLAANSGFGYQDPKTGDKFIVATQGHRYQGIPGDNQFRVLQFQNYGLRISSTPPMNNKDTDSIPTSQLISQLLHHNSAASVELQWRLAMPLSVLLLGLLALPMSVVKPRQGKFAKIFPAVLIYIIYANMILVAQSWLEQGSINLHLGLWWIHGALLLTTIILIGWQLGWQRRIKIMLLQTKLMQHWVTS
jgi:lipopolysaccharide export system permease protein